MDDGTDARDILENKIFPLRRGTKTAVGYVTLCVLLCLVQFWHILGVSDTILLAVQVMLAL